MVWSQGYQLLVCRDLPGDLPTQVVETSVTNNSLSKGYPRPEDHDKPILFKINVNRNRKWSYGHMSLVFHLQAMPFSPTVCTPMFTTIQCKHAQPRKSIYKTKSRMASFNYAFSLDNMSCISESDMPFDSAFPWVGNLPPCADGASDICFKQKERIQVGTFRWVGGRKEGGGR